MGYRGEDLDLRTPRNWDQQRGDLNAAGTADGADKASASFGPDRRPIWVDDVVLACCNTAFDIARAHQAGEVRLEHLLNAMTRIDGAAEILEGRGIRVFVLRRETATLIASEPPGPSAPTASGPPRSNDFENVLQHAAGRAYRRSTPAGIDDLIDVLSDHRLEMPALAMFARATARPMRELPPVNRALPFAAEPTAGFGPRDVLRDRIRQAPASYVREPSHAVHREPLIDRVDAKIGNPELLLKIVERLEALEHSVSSLRAHTAAEKSSVSNALVDVRQAIENRSAEIQVREISVLEKLAAIELQLAQKTVPAVDFNPLGQRFDMLELALQDRNDESGEFASRLAAIEQAIAANGDRVQSSWAMLNRAMETLVDAGAAQERASETGRATVIERVDRVVTALTRVHSEQIPMGFDRLASLTGEFVDELNKRAALTEAAVVSVAREAAEHGAQHAAELGRIGEVQAQLESRQGTMSTTLEALARATTACLDNIDGRLERCEAADKQTGELMSRMAPEMSAVHRLITHRYGWRNRFWYWLFGTEDWVSASWPGRPRIESTIRSAAAP